jgi:hypothetical protein
VVIALVIVFAQPARSLFLFAVMYALSAPVTWLFKGRRRPPAEASPTTA